MNRPPLIADVCGTLVWDDTTLGLLRHHFARQPDRRWRLPLLRLLTVRQSPFRLVVAVIERLSGQHVLKYGLVRLLAGDLECDLRESASDYAKGLLQHRRIPMVWSVVEHALKERRLVLASASIEPAIQALAELLGVDYVASKLETLEGRLTGRYLLDLTGQKIHALKAVLGPDFLQSNYGAISDNFTDRELLAGADQAYVVLHRKSHLRHWADIDTTILRVQP